MRYLIFMILLVSAGCWSRPRMAGLVSASPDAVATQEQVNETAASPEAAPAEDPDAP